MKKSAKKSNKMMMSEKDMMKGKMKGQMKKNCK